MRETHRNLAFVALGLVLLAAAAVVPVGTVHWHDTSVEQPDYIEGNETGLRSEGYRVVAYENLSERAQDLYVATLENGGEYRVPPSDGADDYDYPTRAEVIERANMSDPGARYPMHVIVERPNGTVDLPPADEERPDATYDAMMTKTSGPPLLAVGRIHQLLLALAGIATLGYGGSKLATL
ncbi:hypothetical protein ACFQMA_19905 [Halosimplex aquaticum]|uniref:DUF3592 domain-containing protein n=1 Tax=Halosimplex aquaticum TaxID=3026162 RepID=A0ABD5Y4C6_9EURY|nr:hypothetical protein [Halosimplex aquaticum]